MKLHKTAQLAPVSTNDLPTIQGWLQAMAAQGLLLEACDNGTFFFRREAPVQRRYRVDPSKGNTMGVATPQLQDMYREFGWTYVDSYTRYHHVFCTDDPNAVEPFTTPEALVEQLERVKQKRIVYHLISLGILFLLQLLIVILNPASFSLRNVISFVILGILSYYDIAPLLKLKKSSDAQELLKLRIPDGTERKLHYLRVCVTILLAWLILAQIF